jgi:hypothetical protein
MNLKFVLGLFLFFKYCRPWEIKKNRVTVACFGVLITSNLGKISLKADLCFGVYTTYM